MRSLSGKTLILTGASMGIGRALAVQLAGLGVNLILNARTTGPLSEACEECRQLGAHTEVVTGSVGSPVVVGELVHRARQTGAYYGFIHVAGILAPGPAVWELEEDLYREVLESNVNGAWQLIRLGIQPLLNAGDGLAVFFGSGAADIAQPGIGAYCAAKAAEEHLMRQLAAETDTVTTFAYRPGVVETRMQSQARNSKGFSAEKLQSVFRHWKENGELLTPEDAAAGLISVLQEDFSKYHGQTVDIRNL